MRILLIGCCLVCLSATRVQSKPQITKLFPVRESMDVPQQSTNEARPLDRILGKLRATYNFVFRKPENTSNIERILAKDAADPNVQALELIWSDRMRENSVGKEDSKDTQPQRSYLGSDENRVNDIQPLDRLEPLEPLEPLELEDETVIGNDRDVEIVTQRNAFQFPVTISRHLVDWLGSLLGITYGVYSKLARALHSNDTIRVH